MPQLTEMIRRAKRFCAQSVIISQTGLGHLARAIFAIYATCMTYSAFQPRIGKAPFRIGLLCLPDSNLMSLAAALDPFQAANRCAGQALYEWQFLSPEGGKVELSTGLSFDSAALPFQVEFDLMVVVAGPRLDMAATPALRAWLRQLRSRKIAYCGVDGGVWVLARAGLLRGRRATTHWEDLDAFALAFDEIEVQPDRYVIDGAAMSTAGAAPCLDLMLHMIRCHHGADLSGQVANTLLYDPATGPAPQRLVAQARLSQMAPPVAQAVAIMETRLQDPPAIAEIAREVGLSPRRLEMVFQQHLESGPGAFFLRLRLSEARRLALDTRLGAQEIAQRTGFSSPSTLARAFKQCFGASISELRAAQSRA